MNHTAVTEFILLGFTENPKLQVILLVMFLLIYLLILVGNLGMVTLIRIESRLHTPMYFFLSNLALLDVGYATIITSSTLITLVTARKVILFTGCALQFFFLCVVLSCECYLLGIMAYNRFMAICNPLLYTVIMSKQFCVLLVLESYFMNIHFTCTAVVITSTLLIILVSYIYIVVTILKISFIKGRHKAFSTCASHLTAITILHEAGSFIYLRPSSKYLMDYDKIISLLYTFVIPMLNPLIYSLRNKEVNQAFQRIKLFLTGCKHGDWFF
uniref:G-protein coupled receptors family 1 profile domain-containing protein n=1 Tax=Chelonoidis abingdonii TaxID=106734 RepID=A0A8C0GFM8_CHEAB